MLKPKFILILFAFLFLRSNASDPIRKPMFISPGISFGYTFGAKVNYGFTLDVGFIENKSKLNYKYGLSFYQYYVVTKRHVHRLRSVSLMYQNNFIDVKFGPGRAKNPWGYSKRNKCIVHGFAFDISARYPSVYSPWLGYRYFRFNRADWAWFMDPYKSVYVKYNFDVIQNTGLKESSVFESRQF